MGDRSDKVECHSELHRVLAGQLYQFDSWQGHVGLLVVMLSSSKRR